MRILALILCVFCLSSHATIFNVACDNAAISTAFASAGGGDTINVAAGDCFITNRLTWTHSVNLIGAGPGSNNTILRSGAIDFPLQVSTTDYGILTTISNITFYGNITNSFGMINAGRNVNVPTITNGPLRVTHCFFPDCWYRGVSLGAQIQGGALVDHCAFLCPNAGHNEPISYNGNSYYSWTNANPLGTTNVNCVENCYFDMNVNSGNGVYDAYDGAQLVFRYNVCTGSVITGVHGYDSQPTSCRTWEVYNNLFTNVTGGFLLMEFRGGCGVVFSNVVTSAVADFAELAYYRTCASAHAGTVAAYGLSGAGTTNQLDGFNNFNPDAVGYPGNQQPGIISSTATNAFMGLNTQTASPCYCWSNNYAGVDQGFTLKDNTAPCNFNITNLVKLGRDYFNNTPRPGYTPLVFPHPLDIEPQASPTQLRAHR